MKKPKLIEPVFSAKINQLYQAAKFLAEHGIASRHSSPKRATGILRVAQCDAQSARSLLPQIGAEGVISANEAAHFFCPTCNATLSAGMNYCPNCNDFVGDAHAL